jgi:hypothetical protein
MGSVVNFEPSRRAIPSQLAAILQHSGVNGNGWVATVRQFGRWF